MPNAKPYVAAATLCEKVLIEPDSVASLIRMVDVYALQAPSVAPPPGALPALTVTLFVCLKSGDVTGPGEVGIHLRKPSGESAAVEQKWPVVLNGGEHGVNLKLEVTLAGEPGQPPKLGLYWFDVLWGGETLTSIPLRLKSAGPPVASPTQP